MTDGNPSSTGRVGQTSSWMATLLERPIWAERIWLPEQFPNSDSPHIPNGHPRRPWLAPQLSRRCRKMTQQMPKRCSRSRGSAQQSGQFKPISAQFWPMLARVFQNRANMRRNSPILAKAANIGQRWHTFGSSLSKLARSGRNCFPLWAELGQTWADIAWTWPMLATSRPLLDS